MDCLFKTCVHLGQIRTSITCGFVGTQSNYPKITWCIVMSYCPYWLDAHQILGWIFRISPKGLWIPESHTSFPAISHVPRRPRPLLPRDAEPKGLRCSRSRRRPSACHGSGRDPANRQFVEKTIGRVCWNIGRTYIWRSSGTGSSVVLFQITIWQDRC